MRVILHRDFKRQVKKLKNGEQKRVLERLVLFQANPKDPILNNHKLGGQYHELSSINITGDLRALFCIVKEGVALFITVDTHSNLYS